MLKLYTIFLLVGIITFFLLKRFSKTTRIIGSVLIFLFLSIAATAVIIIGGDN
jgi:hypothetical protein